MLEDTDGDGRVDKTSVFLEGLNIPSGIAVGHGGVWIANSPDLLFVHDSDGDGKADRQEVVVTGFGRDDTHELPNSLTWGPDGWLYGLNGVFNPSHVTYGPANPNYREGQQPWDFTCAMFRIHPRTKEFQVFCEGTSNPWGIAFNDHGEAFVSGMRHRSPLASHANRLLPPPGWPLSAIYVEDRKHRRLPPPEGRLLRHSLVRQ
ncbi:MAG UNVERIFIED_CONTAM: hypothetical protein LVR18_24470 [Planctomycetaceae bacterium]